MTRFTGFLAVLTAIALCSASLAAKPKDKPKKSADDRFAAMDKDGDKKLSLDEFVGKKTETAKEKATTRFGKLDKNADKSLSLEEFKAGQKSK